MPQGFRENSEVTRESHSSLRSKLEDLGSAPYPWHCGLYPGSHSGLGLHQPRGDRREPLWLRRSARTSEGPSPVTGARRGGESCLPTREGQRLGMTPRRRAAADALQGSLPSRRTE